MLPVLLTATRDIKPTFALATDAPEGMQHPGDSERSVTPTCPDDPADGLRGRVAALLERAELWELFGSACEANEQLTTMALAGARELADQAMGVFGDVLEHYDPTTTEQSSVAALVADLAFFGRVELSARAGRLRAASPDDSESSTLKRCRDALGPVRPAASAIARALTGPPSPVSTDDDLIEVLSILQVSMSRADV